MSEQPHSRTEPFEGVKVLDFTWGAVGPVTIRYLADHGATVLRVESVTRFDPMRALPPHQNGVFHLNTGQPAANSNANKYGLGLDLTKPKALEIVKKILVEWGPDVLAESFGPGVTSKFGLDYASVSQVRPDIVYFSTCQLGQSGPYASYRGYGNLAAAIAGYYTITGWPDRDPTGPYGAFSDFLTPPLAVTALIAALDHRRRTGEGQNIDVAQMEASVQYLGSAVLDYTANGRVAMRSGNRDPFACPHGAFQCRGEGQWVSIAISSEEEWQALCKVLGHDEWAKDPRFADLYDRKRNEDQLEQYIGEATSLWDSADLVEKLQEAGVPAGVVYNCFDIHKDPQLKHLQFLHTNHQPQIGDLLYQAKMFDLSKASAGIRWDCIYVGHHNEKILREFLGFTEEEIADFAAEGVIEFSY